MRMKIDKNRNNESSLIFSWNRANSKLSNLMLDTNIFHTPDEETDHLFLKIWIIKNEAFVIEFNFLLEYSFVQFELDKLK